MEFYNDDSDFIDNFTVKLPKFHLNHDISFAVDDEDKAPNDYQIKIGKLAKKKKGKKKEIDLVMQAAAKKKMNRFVIPEKTRKSLKILAEWR